MSQQQLTDLERQVKDVISSGSVWAIRRLERKVVDLRFVHVEDQRLHSVQSKLRMALA